MVDPHDVDGLTKALREVLTNPDLKEDLRARGLIQASKFSWEEAAEKTWAVYANVKAGLAKRDMKEHKRYAY
jgi:glycosyltransferase involved in cell wall biosynthesis